MTRNIEWLKEEIGTEMIQLEPNRKERWSDVKYQTLRNVAQKIAQLDEPAPHLNGKEWLKSQINDNARVETSHLLDYTNGQDWRNDNLTINKGLLFDFINQTDNQLKPTIPQFVADWYEEHKDNLEKQLQGIAFNLDKYGKMPEVNGLDKWINETEYPMQTLASLRFGYTVEEKKYRVKLPDNESKSTTNILALRRTQDGRIVINQVSKTAFIENENSFLTEDEIKRNHEYLWGLREEVSE